MVGKKFGLVTIIDPHITRQNGYMFVMTQCTICGNKKQINLNSLERGISQGCQSCSQTKSKHSKILGQRYDAIIARCTNRLNPAYPRYGGRGVKNLFASRMEFILYVEKELPHDSYHGLEIDRIDNNGHYEPGNLRLATRKQNMQNRENTAKISYRGEMILLSEFESPYSYGWTYKLMKLGMTGEQILERKKLTSMTF
jgi:hypothetical protein